MRGIEMKRLFTAITGLLIFQTTALAIPSKDIPSGDYVIGTILKKSEPYITIKVTYPPFCSGDRIFRIKDEMPGFPVGVKVKAYFTEDSFCDDEDPVIKKIEVIKDEES